jgi:hypothetical protein
VDFRSVIPARKVVIFNASPLIRSKNDGVRVSGPRRFSSDNVKAMRLRKISPVLNGCIFIFEI